MVIYVDDGDEENVVIPNLLRGLDELPSCVKTKSNQAKTVVRFSWF